MRNKPKALLGVTEVIDRTLKWINRGPSSTGRNRNHCLEKIFLSESITFCLFTSAERNG